DTLPRRGARLPDAARPDRPHAGRAAPEDRTRARAKAPREARVPESRWVEQGPDRAVDDRGSRARREAQAGRDDRRADLRQHRSGPRARGGDQGLPDDLRRPRQGRAGEDRAAPRVRSRGRDLPDRGRARLAEEIPGGYKPDQYSNPGNPDAHYRTTGPEIWEQTGGELDAVVISVGTGG